MPERSEAETFQLRFLLVAVLAVSLLLLSTLGGISLFGAVGLVPGPIVAAVFVTLQDVYGRAFAPWLPGEAAPDAEGEEAPAG